MKAIRIAAMMLVPLFAVSTEAMLCERVFLPEGPVFQQLRPHEKPVSSDRYFQGTEQERKAHNAEMRSAGSREARALIDQFQNEIPENSSVLEVGPFLEPQILSLGDRHPLKFWEYDSEAAQKLADDPRTQTFQVDLNRLTEDGWSDFLARQKPSEQKDMKLGAAVLSSVLNYVDAPKVLQKVIDNLADGGILFLSNSNVGDPHLFSRKRPWNGSQILEHLMLEYAGRIEFLSPPEFTLNSMDGSRTGISLAVRIRKQPNAPPIDAYETGLGAMADFDARPYELKYPQRQDPQVVQVHKSYWESRDPAIVAEVTKKHDYLQYFMYYNLPGRYHPLRVSNRLYVMNELRLRNRQTIANATKFEVGSPEALKFQDAMRYPERETFLPEREVLADAQDISLSHRSAFLEEGLTRIYARLGSKP